MLIFIVARLFIKVIFSSEFHSTDNNEELYFIIQHLPIVQKYFMKIIIAFIRCLFLLLVFIFPISGNFINTPYSFKIVYTDKFP